jgi:uncharacterized membrane protein
MGGKGMEISKLIYIAVVGLVSGVLSMAANVAAATFTSIDFPNATSTDALGINSAGDIIGRYVSADGNTHGFLRNRRGRFIPINFRGANFTVAAGIDAFGNIVGQYRLRGEQQGVRHGFLVRNGRFTRINAPHAVFTNALGISGTSKIVGRYCTVLPCFPANEHGFLMDRGHFSTIDFPGPAGTIAGTNAWGINDRGEIVGGYQSSNGQSHVYLRRQNQFTTIDFPNAVDPNVVDTAPLGSKGGINSGGDIVSYYCNLAPCVITINNPPNLNLNNGSEHGLLLREGAFTRVDITGSLATLAFGINPRGDIVGSYHDAIGKEHGFLLEQ